MHNSKGRLVLHILGILIFLMLPVVLAPKPEGVSFISVSLPAIRDLLAGCFMVGFFYLNYYLIVPRFFLKKRYTLYFLQVLFSFFVIIFLPSQLTGYSQITTSDSFGSQVPPLHMVDKGRPQEITPGMPQGSNPDRMNQASHSSFLLSVSHNILLFLSVTIFSVLLRVQEKLYRSEQAKSQMEILSLRDQINPHFLFNMLNNIYGQAILDNSKETANSILKLSGLLRYVVHESQSETVSLEKELAYLQNYIQLQRQRVGDSTELTYVVKGRATADMVIAPLLLTPFIENTFKHGVNPDEQSNINITISIDEHSLHLQTINKKVHVDLSDHEESGVGLRVTKSRLDLLYPDRHMLSIEDNDDNYVVNLTIQMHA